MLEKTYATFHAFNIFMQQQYEERRFTKYYELIACLLIAEQNNELLLKNHQSRPSGSISLLEANATIQTNRRRRGREYFYGRARGRSRGAIFLGIKVIIINLIIRKTTPITRI